MPDEKSELMKIASPNHFTSCYLTPLVAAGFVASEEVPIRRNGHIA